MNYNSPQNAASASSGKITQKGAEEVVLLLPLLKELLKHVHKTQVIPVRIRGAVPPNRWRRATTGFIGLYGTYGFASWTHKNINL